MKHDESFVQGLTRILVEYNVIKEDEAKVMQKLFRDRSKAAFDDFLLEEGLVSRTDLLNALSKYYNVPAFDVLGHFFNHETVKKFPKGFLLRNVIVPLEHDENIMVLVAGNPQDPDLLSKIGEHVSYDIRFNVGLNQDITDAVKEFYDESPASEVDEVDDPGSFQD